MVTRNKQILFRLTENEYETLNANAKKCGLSRETYIRKVLFGTVPKELPKTDFFETLYQLRMIGRNIQQVAIKANKLNFIDEQLYRNNYEELQNTIGKLMKKMY